ncbi:MAG: hypothetical protein Q8O55_06660, partial [Dehalococcoidales bacterium]|nr:hypothetical protein [Dehalococcoidales bacterium]
WGVLAINPNKSIYLPGETARLGIGVLNETGRTLCEAKITLAVTDPAGSKTILSSENGLVQKSGQCQATSVTNVPDYLAGYKTGKAGIYKMHLEADNGNGVKSLEDSFEVRDSVPFDIERSDYPMRIYPPAEYFGKITVKANQDFTGTVEEEVPASFDVKSQNANVKSTSQNSKLIIWNVDWKKGEKYELSYSIKFPQISPEFYLVGPLRLIQSDLSDRSVLFSEARQWQIASDVITTLFMDTPDATQAKEFWSAVVGTVAYDTTQKKSGLASWKGTYGSPDGWVAAGMRIDNLFPWSPQAGRITAYFRLQDLPSGFTPLIWIRTDLYDFSYGVNSSGVLQLRTGGENPGTQLGSNGTTLAANTWYRISIAWNITNTTTFTIKVFLDGTLDITGNSGTLSADAANMIYIGWMESVSSGTKVLWFQHVYMDDDTSLTDTGDIRVTAKLPVDVVHDNFDGSAGAVSQRPITTATEATDAQTHTGTNQVHQDYDIQAASVGDVDISGDTIVALNFWIWAKNAADTAGTPKQVYQADTEEAITLSTSYQLFTKIIDTTTYPSDGASIIGMESTGDTADTFLGEAGVLVAYIQAAAAVPATSFNFNGLKMQGIKIN